MTSALRYGKRNIKLDLPFQDSCVNY